MSRRSLGQSGIEVSRLCLGTIPLGLDTRIGTDAGIRLIQQAVDCGVDFLDTAELYGTQELIGRAVYGREVVIATKSYAYSYEGMDDSLRRARDELARDHIDIFLLHEQESELTLAGHAGAVDRLVKAKADGIVGAIGLSTHFVAGVQAGTCHPDIEIIHAIINMEGVGIRDGTCADMLAALQSARSSDRGIYAMKALGGGHLVSRAEEALGWVLDLDCVDSVAVGMSSQDELAMNVCIVGGQSVNHQLVARCRQLPRQVMVESHCKGCGDCVKACSQQALSIKDNKAVPDHALCIMCGYCVARCEDMAIKLF